MNELFYTGAGVALVGLLFEFRLNVLVYAVGFGMVLTAVILRAA